MEKLYTGFTSIDALTGGLARGEVMLVGARPGMGKTSFVREIMRRNKGTEFLDLNDHVRDAALRRAVSSFCKICGGDGCIVIDEAADGQGDAPALVQLAKEFMLPIVAVVRLPRALERRAEKRPVLGDFPDRGKGAAVVLALYRDAYYNDPCGSELPEGEVLVLKSSTGSTGAVGLFFDGRAGTWREA